MLRVNLSSKPLMIFVSLILFFGPILLSGAIYLAPEASYAASPCEGNFDDDDDVDSEDLSVFAADLNYPRRLWMTHLRLLKKSGSNWNPEKWNDVLKTLCLL